jgi:dipeptidyl aminopeptidase/acylaminoacyl peptidase
MDGEPMAATDYRELVQVSEPRLSPDGERVAFLRTVPADDEEYDATVCVVPFDGGTVRQFTASDGRDGAPRWSPSGDRLAFTSDRGDADRPQLWVLPADGGEARQVTDVPGGVATPAWSPDGSRLAFAQRVTADEREAGRDVAAGDYERETPDPRVIDRTVYRAGARYLDGARSHVYTVPLAGATAAGEPTRHTDGEYDFTAPTWGASDELYYAVNRQPDPDDSPVLDIELLEPDDDGDGEPETVTRTSAWQVGLAATEDGRVAYPYTPEEKLSMRQTELEVYDRTTGETVRVTSELDRTVLPGSIAFEDGSLLFLTPDEGDVVLRRAPPEDAAAVETLVTEGELTAATARGERLALARSEWDHRGDVFALEADEDDEDGDLRRLTEVNADLLADRHVGEPEPLVFESDGHEIQGWLLTPPDAGEEAYPLVVEVHGGPHAMWTTSGTMFHEFQTLAARGYCVFWSNPRGSTGYGEAFATAIDGDWGAVTARDVLAGADAACEHPNVDAGEQFLTGGSFGGYMTAWLVAHTDRFDGAVAQRGVYDLASFYGSTDAFKLVEWEFDATPWAEPERLFEHSPASHAPEVETPTLIVHADADYRVPVNNAEMLYRHYRKLGVETRLVRYPREGHELSRSGEPAHVVDRIERIARWFDGYSDHRGAPPALERGREGLSGSDGGDDDAEE